MIYLLLFEWWCIRGDAVTFPIKLGNSVVHYLDVAFFFKGRGVREMKLKLWGMRWERECSEVKA